MWSDRTRGAVIPVTALTAAGAGMLVAGSYAASRALYVGGLLVLTAGLLLLVLLVSAGLRRLARLVLALVVVAATVGLGLWIPHRALAAEFDGSGVRWAVPSLSAGVGAAYSDDEFVTTVIGTDVVLANPTSARIVSAVDGRQIATIPADRSDTFSVAHGRLLVVSDRSARLYTRDGRPVWPEAVTAERGVAAGAGITVMEDEGTVSAIADDGSVRWTRRVVESRATRRFPAVFRLPESNTTREHGPPVLADLAALPVPDSGDRWAFADPASGDVVTSLRGEYAGSVGGTAATVADLGHGRCELRTRTAPASGVSTLRLPCTFAKPWEQDGTLFFENGADATAVRVATGYPDTEPVGLRDVGSLDVAGDGTSGRLSVSSTGISRHDGRLVRGYPGVGYENGWTFTGASDRLDLDVREHTTVVTAELRRTNPFDPRPGRTSPDDLFCDCDHRVTVIDQADGTVTGSIRVHEVDSVLPLANGAAVVAADGRIRLIGRPPGGTG